MKFSTSNHSSSSSVVLFLSLGFQFANTVNAKSSIRGLQTGNAAAAAAAAAPATEPDACVTDCGIGPWSALCLHLQSSLSTGIDFDTAMGDYDFTAMELEMISNSTALTDEDDVPPGPPVEAGSPAAGGRPSGSSDSKTGPSDSKSGPSDSMTGPSDSMTGPSLDEPPSGPSDDESPSGPSDSMTGPSLDGPPSGPSDDESPSGPSDSMTGPSLDEPPSGPSDEDGPGLPSGPSGTGPSGSALLEETEQAP